MSYYYNVDGKFQKESGREYKTEKGALERLQKEGKGAVFDEKGKMIHSLVEKGEIPEGALDANESVLAFNEDKEQVGTADAETASETTGDTEREADEAETSEGEVDEAEPSETEPEDPEPEGELDEPEQTGRAPFKVQTTCDLLRIRSGPGQNYGIVGYIQERAWEKKTYTITEEKDGFGRLENRTEWIELAYTKNAG